MGGGDYTPQPTYYPTVETTVKEVPVTQSAKSVSESSKAATEQQQQKNKKAKGIAGSILTSKATGPASNSAGGMTTAEDANAKSKTLG